MRFIALIFALLTLLLSSLPCSDGVNETVDAFQTEENHNDHSEDECTPFCVCACCGIAIPFEVLAFESENFNKIIISNRFEHENLFTQGYITSIWHPPAVG